MKQSTTTYVAMDTHKKTISIALAEGGRRGETRFIGEIPSRPEAVAKMVDRLAKKHGQVAFWCARESWRVPAGASPARVRP